MLSGATSTIAADVMATFPNLVLQKAGTYTLKATDGSLTSVPSTSFTLVPGTASLLLVTQQPTNASAGSTISPAVTVAVEDPFWNVVSTDTSNVTLVLGANPGNATLQGTTTMTAVNGVATFANLSLTAPGNGYTLTASRSGLPSVTSTPFTITGSAVVKAIFVAGLDNQVYAQTFDSQSSSTSNYFLGKPGLVQSLTVSNSFLPQLFAIGLDNQVYEEQLGPSGQATVGFGLVASGQVKSFSIGNYGGFEEGFATGLDNQVYADKLDANGNPLGGYRLTQPGQVKTVSATR